MSERPLASSGSTPDPPRVGQATTRQQILAAATMVMRERGLVGMTTRSIAREAGLADGTLYIHFPHKQDLVLATLEAQLPQFSAALPAPASADSRSLQATLEEVVRAALRYTTALVPWSGALFADPHLLAGLQTALGHERTAPHLLSGQIAEYIASEQRRGRIKARLDPLRVPALVLGPCFQHTFLRHLLGAATRAPSDDEFVTELVQTLLICLGRRHARTGAKKGRARRLTAAR